MSLLRQVPVPDGLPPVDPSALPGLLRWPDDGSEAPLVRAVGIHYLSRATRAFGGLLRTIVGSGHPRGPELEAVARGLPNEAMFRAVTAPEVFAVLAGSSGRTPDEIVGFLIESLRAEREGVGWTPLGDRRDGAPGPKLAGGPPVDASSPSAIRLVEPRCGPALPWDPADVDRVVGLLGDAFALLADLAPAAHRLVRDLTRVVVLRREGEHPDVFRSSSTNGAVGRTLLVNPQLPSVTVVDLADALLHEAVHHLLYMAELAHPMLLDPAACAAVRPVSPWTGNGLTVHSYLHACLVWFGLLQLWSRPGARELPSGAARVATLRAGFERGPLMGPLEPVRASLAPWVARALEDVAG